MIKRPSAVIAAMWLVCALQDPVPVLALSLVVLPLYALVALREARRV